MRFLIDVTDFRLQWHGKYNRVLRRLAGEARTNNGILVNISGGDIRLELEYMIGESEQCPLWVTAQWRNAVSIKEIQRISKLMASFITFKLFGSDISKKLKHDLSWTFANSFELFPVWLRLRIAHFLEVEGEGRGREMFHHWVSERGEAFQRAEERGEFAESLQDLNEQDTLVLAGASWGHIDVNALESRKKATGFKLVYLVYDLLPIDYPSIVTVRQYLEYKRFLIGIGRIADLILAANGSSATRINDFLGGVGVAAEDRVACLPVFGAALRDGVGSVSKRIQGLGLHQRPFMLCQSTLRERKHVLWLYALCAKLCQAGENFPLLVLAGRADDLRVLRILVEDPAWGRAGVFIETPKDDELVWLYQHAQLCLYPAFEGGLGMSVMEAVEFGRPCIAADAPSLREASRGHALHLPRDKMLWANAICSALEERVRANCVFCPPLSSKSDLLSQITSLLHQKAVRAQ